MPDPLIYAERMLSPFHGVVNVVETAAADAVSRDGVHWTLYVHGERESSPGDPWGEVQTPDIKFAIWSVGEGLKRAPVRPTSDYLAIEHAGLQLLAAIEHNLPRLPFPLADRHELWLLDAEARLPLALLHSAREPPGRAAPPAPLWNPGELCRRTFRSDTPEASRSCGQCAGEVLAELVNAAAGRVPTAQWLRREPDGSGTGATAIDLDDSLAGRRLSRESFPELLLRRRWREPSAQRLVDDFLDWQAPWLLLLQDISPSTRAKLEPSACRQADRVADQRRLYPAICDRARIRAALVEARLRKVASRPPAAPVEDSLCPFYIEL